MLLLSFDDANFEEIVGGIFSSRVVRLPVLEPKWVSARACRLLSVKFSAAAGALVESFPTELHLNTAIEANADSTFGTMPINAIYSSTANVARFGQALVAH
jgi:hypothetical protein